ncbi:lytic murein transglycosylase [Pelovirga terrestris]|uniref:Lytic murein transglycosylase n=1 Tax=Pelovirga terrestris TaxID=2771352 RepID=A0A8J6QN24_9BACT|nr:lytic murein transglycosylase [Pelovirga terrestris]MBD1401779.1 lytic murein transglycosylase [Pelovirga terrestris]
MIQGLGALLLLLMFAWPPHAHASTDDFRRCLADLRTTARDQGVSADTFHQATADLTPDLRTLDRMERQVELTLTVAQYLTRQVTDDRVRTGRVKLAEQRKLLADLEQRYGVDPAIIVAIWGMESSFGAAAGTFPVIRSLATLSCYGRRQPFFRNEFFSALKILEREEIAADDFLGSWAGAFGQTQFIPTSFERLAVDYDHDGRRDIIGNVGDALASAANYLKQAGWVAGQPWGFAVRVPPDFTSPVKDWRERRPLSFWQEQGLTGADGSALITANLPATTAAGLIAAEGNSDRYFLVLTNFDALHRYNPAVNYALAIAHLADRIR